MPQPARLDPGPYAAQGGPIGVLLIHGFTGCAAETRPLGVYLAERGLTVRCPLLRGHGTRVEDLAHVRWQDWAEEVEGALCDLLGHCESVFVGGLSLGGLLCLWLGAHHPEIAGLLPMAPAVQLRTRTLPLTLVARHLLRYSPLRAGGDSDLCDPQAQARRWCYDRTPLWGAGEIYHMQRAVRHVLGRVRQPLLLFQGRHDSQVSPRSLHLVLDRVASTDRTLIWLEHSGHNLLVDGERESVWAQSHAWIVARASQK